MATELLRNFLIVGTQRTGSSALCHSLNMYSDIACGFEWAREFPHSQKLTAAQRALTGDFTLLAPVHRNRISKHYHEGTRWLGFKILFRSSDKWLFHPSCSPALWLDRLEDYVRWVSKRPAIHVIHIVRSDAVEWLKSKYLARKIKAYHNTPYPTGTKVRIPLRQAIRRIHAKNWVDARLASLATTNPYLRLFYEDFLDSKQATLSAVLSFLECDATEVHEAPDIGHEKQSRAPAAEYISNYDELTGGLGRRGLLTAAHRSV